MSYDIDKIEKAIKLLEEKLQSKTFIKAIGGKRIYNSIKTIIEYTKQKLQEENKKVKICKMCYMFLGSVIMKIEDS